jgi:hypothetical protein
MIEKYLHDSVSVDRKALELKMAGANLINKVLRNRAEGGRRQQAPAPNRDTLPSPEDIPTEVPENTGRETGRRENP